MEEVRIKIDFNPLPVFENMLVAKNGGYQVVYFSEDLEILFKNLNTITDLALKAENIKQTAKEKIIDAQIQTKEQLDQAEIDLLEKVFYYSVEGRVLSEKMRIVLPIFSLETLKEFRDVDFILTLNEFYIMIKDNGREMDELHLLTFKKKWIYNEITLFENLKKQTEAKLNSQNQARVILYLTVIENYILHLKESYESIKKENVDSPVFPQDLIFNIHKEFQGIFFNISFEDFFAWFNGKRKGKIPLHEGKQKDFCYMLGLIEDRRDIELIPNMDTWVKETFGIVNYKNQKIDNSKTDEVKKRRAEIKSIVKKIVQQKSDFEKHR